MIIAGMAVYAIGFSFFILPYEIVIGGMAGFGTLVFYFTGERIPVAVAMYGGNLILLAIGFKILGKGFVIRTIFGASILSLFIGLLEGYATSHPPLIEDMTMSVIMGAVFCGIGIGLYYSHHGTSGGTDIVAAIMEKLTTISVGRSIMIFDMSIVAVSFFLPFDGDMEARIQARAQTIIYGWVAIFLYSYIADHFIIAGRRTVQFFILSDKWERIAFRVTHETGRGVTTLPATGYWTGQGRVLMMIWCRMVDTHKIFHIINEEDSTAYITYSNVGGVWGNGFDILKLKHNHLKKEIEATEPTDSDTPTE